MSGEDSIRSFPVPDLGEGLQEVTVTCWSVAVGDDVEINQTLCSVETAKAEVEIPSPYAGRIVELGGAEGDVLKVGAELVRIDTGPTAVAQPNGEGAVPTLVGYGADAAIETSRRTSRPLAAPVVRKLAKELAVDLAALQRGSGAGGVITRADVLAAARGGVGAGPDVRPVHGVHARMAEKMTLSHKEIPTAKASVEVICAELLRLRDRFVSAAPEITPFALTLRLLVIALKHNVILNSTWVDSGEGPQVHVSNFGALGVDDGVPVINHPEAAILGLGAIKPRPVVVGGEVVARPTMTLTCVFDHRVVDGAQVAQFMCELRDLIESPETALLDL